MIQTIHFLVENGIKLAEMQKSNRDFSHGLNFRRKKYLPNFGQNYLSPAIVDCQAGHLSPQ